MRARAALLSACAWLVACGDDATVAPARCPVESAGARRVVTADWLNRSLTLLAYDLLLDPACGSEAIVATIDLAAWAPGPLELELTPDGERAVVTVGEGFLAALGVVSDPVPAGAAVLVVDLASRSVLYEIAPSDAPMGVAIDPTGRWAFTANFGSEAAAGSTMSVIDLERGTLFDEIDVGGHTEQVVLSPDGTLGALNLDDTDEVRVFSVAGGAVTLRGAVTVGNDPSDLAWLEGDRVLVTNSLSFSFSLVDVSDPDAPVVIDEQQLAGGSPYGATRVPGSDTVLVGAFLASSTLVPIDTGTTPATIAEAITLAGSPFQLGAAVDAEARFAFVAHPKDHTLSVVDLESREVRALQWLELGGPTYVAVQP